MTMIDRDAPITPAGEDRAPGYDREGYVTPGREDVLAAQLQRNFTTFSGKLEENSNVAFTVPVPPEYWIITLHSDSGSDNMDVQLQLEPGDKIDVVAGAFVPNRFVLPGAAARTLRLINNAIGATADVNYWGAAVTGYPVGGVM